ncbi:unnamed protein product [marine sediment metagenome]|uniref:Uncharacterized protein n=1 Tax=marine sediment metagenome TaxID=412755 RepID=X0WGZ8_9ZZZZ
MVVCDTKQGKSSYKEDKATASEAGTMTEKPTLDKIIQQGIYIRLVDDKKVVYDCLCGKGKELVARQDALEPTVCPFCGSKFLDMRLLK